MCVVSRSTFLNGRLETHCQEMVDPTKKLHPNWRKILPIKTCHSRIRWKLQAKYGISTDSEILELGVVVRGTRFPPILETVSSRLWCRNVELVSVLVLHKIMGTKRSSIGGIGSESVDTFGRSDLEAVNGEEKDQGYDKLCKLWK